ncbi:hypothetical protein PRZ48_013255 [Zasmidium cellare]|uniref:Transcription factor domain-containing protein n=1 Tax=Zasmidium cellare TaxID=395010 RepID=A0ABR0E3I3_ZASCE|nr:hypothetical protein PRZ48_013255 [Zasmidium cellare]
MPRPAVIESLQSPPYHESFGALGHPSILDSPDEHAGTSQSLDLDPELPSPANTNTSSTRRPGQIEFLNYLSESITNICERDDQTGETLYVGQNSSAAFFQAVLATQEDYQLPPDVSIGSAFGLTNRTPLHPFGSLWSATVKVTLGDILGSLPSTERCMRYYRAYSQIAIPFVPYLLDQEDFERRLVNVVQLLSEHPDDAILGQAAADLTYRELAGYALLFSVLASGCQFADEVSSERILTTRVFAISVRQAESQGLHLLTRQNGPEEEMHPMWRAIIHMDCTLALAFDRRPMSFLSARYDAVSAIQRAPEVSFFDLVNALNCVKLEWQTAKQMDPVLRAVETELYMAKVEQVESMLWSDTCTIKSGKSMEARLQQLVFKLHIEHFKARLYRYGSLAKDASPEKRNLYFGLLENSYATVIETFLSVKPLSPIVQVAWDLLFYAISSALILAGLQLTHQTRSHQELLRAFIKSLHASSDKHHLGQPNETSAYPFYHGYAVLESILQQCEERG